MMPPKDCKTQLVNEWIRKADDDVAVALRLISDEEPFCNAIAFHCQQASEKYIKALLAYWDIDFPKTHILAHLVKLVESNDAEVALRLRDSIILTPYGSALRYPGDRPDASVTDARQALQLAQQVRDTILPLLHEHHNPEKNAY